MNYQSIGMIATYVQWLILIADACISLRCLYIIYSMSNSFEEHVSIQSILEKVKKHVTAIIISVCVVVLIEVIKTYFFH